MSNLDTTFLNPREAEDLDQIIQWVFEIGDEAESQGLEVKSTLDFSKSNRKNTFAKIVKFILAVSNRDEYAAQEHFNGYGIMLIGVEKGKIRGVENPPEDKEFLSGVQRFFGENKPTFSFYTHRYESQTILVIRVDPPKNGQDIFICSSEHQGVDKKDNLINGGVYIRESAETKLCDSRQLRELLRRYRGGRFEVDVVLYGAISALRIDKEITDERLEQAAQEYIGNLKAQHSKDKTTYHGLDFQPQIPGEPTVEERIEAAQNWQKRYPETLKKLLELTAPIFYAEITNEGNKPLINPRVELTFSHPVQLLDAEEEQNSPPHKWEVLPFLMPDPYRVPYSLGRTNHALSSGRKYGDPTVINWSPGNIRAGETISCRNERAIVMTNHLMDNPTVVWKIYADNVSEPIVGETPIFVHELGSFYELYTASTYCKRLGPAT